MLMRHGRPLVLAEVGWECRYAARTNAFNVSGEELRVKRGVGGTRSRPV